MFITTGFLQAENKRLLVLGLSRADRQRLDEGRPITLDIRYGELRICLFAGENESEMALDVKALLNDLAAQ